LDKSNNLGDVMKNYRKREQGLTLISLALVLSLIGFFTMLILKIGPIYMDHGKVINALKAVENMPDIETKSKREIRNSLAKRFDVNYVSGISQEDIEITKANANHVSILIEYEVVQPIIGNLSVLVEFRDEVEAGQK
jgi:Domain of unknown function (DUF4845)